MRYGFGVDIWGTNTKIGVFDESGKLIHKWKFATPLDRGGNQILPTIADQIDQYMRKNRLFEDDIIGIGVGIPGPVNNEGAVSAVVNFDWSVFNIDRALAGITGLNVKTGNIANMSALGECWLGNGSKNSAFLAMNIGLGGAVVCNGAVVYGAHGGGGEFGHMLVNRKETEACTCGRKGCAEQYISPTGIVRMTRRALDASTTPSTLRRHRIFDCKDVFNAAAAGDRVSKDVMHQIYDYTGRLLSNVCCVTNPDTVILGGEFLTIGQAAIDGISKAFHKYVFSANENVRFVFASLGTDACIYGAFKTVLDTFG